MMICQIYRSRREEGMYLFVPKNQGLEAVPEALLQRFGEPEPAMVLKLTPERKLARVEAGQVLQVLAEQGYYLQLPPSGEFDPEMQALRQHNTKLT